MAAVYVSNLVINGGTDFTQTFTLESSNSSSGFNLTGYRVDALMRKHSGSSASTVFATSIPNAVGGSVQISLGSSITSSLKPGRYVYDVVVASNNGSGTKTRVIEGMALVREGVTR